MRKWTAEEDEYLLNNFGKMTTDEIMSNLGRTRKTILMKAKLLGFDTSLKPRISESVKSQMHKMIECGYNADEIANFCIVSVITVRRYAKANNLTIAKKKRDCKKKEKKVIQRERKRPYISLKEIKRNKIKSWKKAVRKKWSHICWNCSHATNVPEGYCSWADHLEPVEGWTTKVVGTRNEYHKANGVEFITTSEKFDVVKCPLYEDEAFNKISKLKDENFVRAFDIAVTLKQRED